MLHFAPQLHDIIRPLDFGGLRQFIPWDDITLGRSHVITYRPPVGRILDIGIISQPIPFFLPPHPLFFYILVCSQGSWTVMNICLHGAMYHRAERLWAEQADQTHTESVSYFTMIAAFSTYLILHLPLFTAHLPFRICILISRLRRAFLTSASDVSRDGGLFLSLV